MSITKDVPLNWYSSMKKKIEKDSDNFWYRKLTLKVRNCLFLIAWFRAGVDLTKYFFMKKCCFSLNWAPIWFASCSKNLKCYLVFTSCYLTKFPFLRRNSKPSLKIGSAKQSFFVFICRRMDKKRLRDSSNIFFRSTYFADTQLIWYVFSKLLLQKSCNHKLSTCVVSFLHDHAWTDLMFFLMILFLNNCK